jgi:hypothetical protein
MYWPLCLYPIDEMTNTEALVPIIVVDRLGSERIVSPFRLHEIAIGSSPCETEHIS